MYIVHVVPICLQNIQQFIYDSHLRCVRYSQLFICFILHSRPTHACILHVHLLYQYCVARYTKRVDTRRQKTRTRNLKAGLISCLWMQFFFIFCISLDAYSFDECRIVLWPLATYFMKLYVYRHSIDQEQNSIKGILLTCTYF